jgi:predicted NBD/HSP70 family sugar kinase
MTKTTESNYSKHVVSQIAQVNEGAAIVKLLRRRGPMAQNQLSSVLGVTTPTMCRIVRRLQASDLVAHRSRQNQKTGPIGVALNPQTGHVIGIEYSPTQINLAAISFDGTLMHTKSQPLEIRSAKQLLDAFAPAIKSFMDEYKLPMKRLLGIGAVDYGVVDVTKGMSIKSSLYPEWGGTQVIQPLVDAFGVPVRLMNSMLARLTAVDHLELKGKYEDFILVEYGLGIACGIMSDGRFITGNRGMAGELGHTHVPDFHGHCECGSVGCLEAAAALPAISREMECDGREVLARANSGDKRAMRVVDLAYERIGAALGALVNILNPAAVILDPVLAEAGVLCCATLERAMVQQMLTTHAEQLVVMVSQLKEPVAPIGGALQALDAILDGSKS